jgi:hypothetical protein
MRTSANKNPQPSTLNPQLSTLNSLLSTLYSLLSTLYSLLSTLYSLLSTLYSLLSTLYSLLSTSPGKIGIIGTLRWLKCGGCGLDSRIPAVFHRRWRAFFAGSNETGTYLRFLCCAT